VWGGGVMGALTRVRERESEQKTKHIFACFQHLNMTSPPTENVLDPQLTEIHG